MRRLTRALPVALAATLLVLALCATAAAVPSARPLRGLRLGFSSGADVVLASGNPKTQARWVPRAHAEGAQMVRLSVSWSAVAPATLKRGFNPRNPGDRDYDWTSLDEQVRELTAAHFEVMLTLGGAPRWAEGAHMPRSAAPGTWKPNATDLGEFAHALAVRYDGSYPDPLHRGRKLPRIRYWQVWDEPNLPEELTPQWSHMAAGYRAVSPTTYRAMENAFYRAVKGVSQSNYVVLAGLGPYGDSPSTARSARMHPVTFMQDLLCLSASLRRLPGCAGPVYFDAIDSHPYGIGGPNWHAALPGDVAIPDVQKLTRVLHAGQRLGTVRPAGGKGNWVTETSWDSRPPDPHGVPIQTQARWLEQALCNLWKQGVGTVLWWQLVDSPPIPSYAATYQAGTYYLNGKPKPSATAFRFPFVSWRNGGTVTVWSRAPAAGVLLVQRLAPGGRWFTLARVRVSAREVFELPLRLGSHAILRARLGADTSLPWTQRG